MDVADLVHAVSAPGSAARRTSGCRRSGLPFAHDGPNANVQPELKPLASPRHHASPGAPRRAWQGLRCALAAAVGLAAAAGGACACGLEDPSSIAMRRGMLNIAYPQSLHVGTAVWQAQLAGRLPRDPLAQRADLGPEARAAQRLVTATALLQRFAAGLGGTPGTGPRPSVAIVLTGPVLWSRLDLTFGEVHAQVHVDGPRGGDVVVVTEMPVIEAIVAGRMGFAEAVASGVARLYGPQDSVDAARRWLDASTRRS